jgi:hypothetical protein
LTHTILVFAPTGCFSHPILSEQNGHDINPSLDKKRARWPFFFASYCFFLGICFFNGPLSEKD